MAAANRQIQATPMTKSPMRAADAQPSLASRNSAAIVPMKHRVVSSPSRLKKSTKDYETPRYRLEAFGLAPKRY